VASSGLGLFSANGDGQGVAAAIAVRVDAAGQQTSQVVFQCGTTAGSCVATPIDLGPSTDQVVLVLFGTGLRGASQSGSSKPVVVVNGAGSEQRIVPSYWGPQSQYAGLDQVNFTVPRSFAERGDLRIQVSAGSVLSNTVTALFRGAVLPPTPKMEFVTIPVGEFMMGCSPSDSACGSDEKPLHKVQITKSFEIGKYEVTQAQWLEVMRSNPSSSLGADRPVEMVSWTDVQDFLAQMNARNDSYRYRLPTEAEWEYAARAGTAEPLYGNLDAIAWYPGNSGNQTHPVGQKQPNAWGLYDMLGNVGEWCQDWYDSSYYSNSPAADPPGPATQPGLGYRVVRGRSYAYADGGSSPLRVSDRVNWGPGYGYVSVGFRCVRER
jgi:formylglycine-generating enzyme required for sulfatase activity